MSCNTPADPRTIDAAARRPRVAFYLTVLFIVAVAIRIAAAQWASGGVGRGLDGDEPDYYIRAVNLVEGRGLADAEGRPSSERTPGLPLLLALLFSVAGPRIVWARVLMCVLGALLVPACYLLGDRFAGRRTGLMCAVIAAFFPNWVWYSSFLLTDLLSAVATAFLAWALIEGQRRDSMPWFALAGLIGGAGILFRPTGIVFLPGIVIWVFLVMRGWRRRIQAAVLVCAAFACMLAPWAARNTLLHGEFVPVSSKGGTELYIANNPRATGILIHDFGLYRDELSDVYPRGLYPNEARRSRLYQDEAETFIRENPGRFLRLCAVRFVEFWKIYSPRVSLWQSLMTIGSFGILLPFAIFYVVRRGWRRGAALLLVVLIASQTALNMVFTSVIRYRIPIEPLVLVLAAAGFISLLGRRRASAG